MQYFAQTDPRWAGKVFGTGGGPNIGIAGCAITADGNLQIATSGNEQYTPDWMDGWLKANGGYAEGDLLVWGTVPNLGHVRAAGVAGDVGSLNQFLAAEPNFAIVQFQVGNHLHFCLATAQNTIIDSEDGRQKPLSTYHFVMAHLYTRIAAAPSNAPVPVPAPAPAPAPVATPEGTFNIVVPIPGYTTAALAASRTNAAATVHPGNYHVFNQADGMVNVTVNPGVPGSWVNPGDNKAPVAAAAPPAANYDGNAITIQPGWGLSNAAQAAGYPDSNSPLRWNAIAKLNGSDDWQTYNSQLKVGMRVVVGKYATPVPEAAPAAPAQPTAPTPAPITYTKLSEPLHLVTKQTPTHVWMLDFKTYAEARSAMDLPQGAAFLAYGKAQRTDLDHPAYFMTQEDFGNADTTGIAANGRGINTVDLAPAPAPQVLPDATPAAPGAAKPVAVTAVPDLDKRFTYVPFAEPRWFTAPQPVANILDLRTTVNPDGSIDYPYPAQSLAQDQPVQVAGVMTKGNDKYYRTVVGASNGSYYGIPMAALKPITGSGVLLKLAARLSGMFAKLTHRS